MRQILKSFRPKKVEYFARCLHRSSFQSDDGRREYSKRDDYHLRNVVGVGLASLFAYEYYRRKNTVFLAEASKTNDTFGELRKELPTYTVDDVAKHSNMKDGIWVTYKSGVYDITKFIAQHPGGEQILLAAGSSVEPFWMLYGVHKKVEILRILEDYRIGNIDENEQNLTKDMEDFYGNEPRRHPILKPASQKPFNAEPPPSILVDSAFTPNEIFYVRNHLPVPEVDPKTYELQVEVEGKKKVLTLKLEDLKEMRKHTIAATIMCAGNRRSEMSQVKAVRGLDWGTAAIGNATWTGVRLADVLKLQGIDYTSENPYKHVQFEGLDTDPTNTPYGASIPYWRAVDPKADVLLAYEMNGQPLPRDHGYPIRVIVPGVVGARNVKWLGRIVVSTKESESHWQQNDYKGFSPSTDWDVVDFTKSPAIQELPVTSAICKPTPNSTVEIEDGHIIIKGYAWAGNGQKIVRVDVTADQGKTWTVAKFDYQDTNEPPQHWAWTLWTARVPVPKGTKNVEIWSKAVDSTYNTQPESFAHIWNLRGVLGNAYHRVKVNLK